MWDPEKETVLVDQIQYPFGEYQEGDKKGVFRLDLGATEEDVQAFHARFEGYERKDEDTFGMLCSNIAVMCQR
jgi:hypothetical protein